MNVKTFSATEDDFDDMKSFFGKIEIDPNVIKIGIAKVSILVRVTPLSRLLRTF